MLIGSSMLPIDLQSMRWLLPSTHRQRAACVGLGLLLLIAGSCSSTADGATAALCPPLGHRQLLLSGGSQVENTVSAALLIKQQPLPQPLEAAKTHPASLLLHELAVAAEAANGSGRALQAAADTTAGDAAAPPATVSIAQSPPTAPKPVLPPVATSQPAALESATVPTSASEHKTLWPDVTSRDYAMFAVAAVVLFVAAGAGVGGGPVLVPTYLLLGLFSNTAAVALSNITICGGSIANVLCTVHKRHPFKERSLVDWDLILLMEPPTIIGAVAGSYLNKVIPVWISHILLALLLTVLTARMAQRAQVIYKRETLTHMHTEVARARAESQSTSMHGSQQQQQQQQQQEGKEKETGQEQQQQQQQQEEGKEQKMGQEQQQQAEQLPAQQDVRQQSRLTQLKPPLNKEGSQHAARQGSSFAACQQQEQPQQDSQKQEPGSNANVSVETCSCSPAPPGVPQSTSFRAMSGLLPSSVLLNIELDGHRSCEDADLASPSNMDEGRLAYAAPGKSKRTRSFHDSTHHSGDGVCELIAGGAPAPAPEVAASSACEAAALANVLREERQRFPLLQLCMAVAMFVFTLLTSLFSKSAARCGSWQAWTIQLALVPSLLAICLYMRAHLLWKARVKADAQVDTSGELHWNARNTLVFPAICSLAGVMAGMFGLGGAVVMTPLMLELGVHPQVTSATTHPMLLFTTASATVTYAQLGDIPWTYACVCVSIAFVMSLAGQFLIDRIIKRVGRSSVLVILLACFFTLATMLTYYIVASGIVELTRNPELLTASGSICGKKA